MKNLFAILAIVFTIYCSAQKKDYKFLTTDQYDTKWYYSFEKKTSDGFYSWLKVEETLKTSPSAKSTEYLIEFKCSNKTMSDEIVIINWREGKPNIYRKKYPFTPVPKKHIGNSLLEKYCS
ncbi:hypothetical protein ACFQO9_02415 [Chryseobacterium zhengzhouense]|uniref:Uncharacterized protein n=1 Tax=Chryseobacterium zhengzhouense TaxID=1636086 RepID=A0ABW2LSP2_9FLAO